MVRAESGLRILARRQEAPGTPDPTFPMDESIDRELSDLFSLMNIDPDIWGRAIIPYEPQM